MNDVKNSTQTNGQRLGLAMGGVSALTTLASSLPDWLKVVPVLGIISIVMYFMFLEAKLKSKK
jgi:hypothetical protein